MTCPTSFELQNLDSNYVPYTTMLVQRDNTIDYHLMILARNGTIPDRTSCWRTEFIKSADYLFLTEPFVDEVLKLISFDDEVFVSTYGNVESPQVPLDILTRGPLALKAYKETLARGETSVRRVPLMLIGQGGAGKTSTKKSLKGICFDPNEDRTVGIDVDPSYFKVSTETWRTGEQGQDQNSDTAVYLDYHLARCIADSLKTQENSIQWNTDRDSLDSEIIEVPEQPITTEESRDKDQKEEAAAAKRLSRGDLNDDSFSLSTVPEEIVAVTEQFLREWG
ncbi:hypothetical protein ABFA07_003472 [Porites harrisoni]